MVKRDFLDVLFWLFLFIALGWVIGKLAGLFSPEWLEFIPIISIIFAAGIAYQRLIFFIRTMEKRTDYLKNHLDKLEEKQIETDKRLYLLEKQQDLFLSLIKTSEAQNSS